MNIEEPLTSNVRPATDAVLTVRIVKSFPYRNVKNHIMPSVNLKETTPLDLIAVVRNAINTSGALRPYRNVVYDTLKLYTKAHGTKSMQLVINLDHDDDWILLCEDPSNTVKGDKKSLYDLGIENETEISLFNWSDYKTFKENPEEKWWIQIATNWLVPNIQYPSSASY